MHTKKELTYKINVLLFLSIGKMCTKMLIILEYALSEKVIIGFI